jgi:hypothetical protein
MGPASGSSKRVGGQACMPSNQAGYMPPPAAAAAAHHISPLSRCGPNGRASVACRRRRRRRRRLADCRLPTKALATRPTPRTRRRLPTPKKQSHGESLPQRHRSAIASPSLLLSSRGARRVADLPSSPPPPYDKLHVADNLGTRPTGEGGAHHTHSLRTAFLLSIITASLRSYSVSSM